MEVRVHVYAAACENGSKVAPMHLTITNCVHVSKHGPDFLTSVLSMCWLRSSSDGGIGRQMETLWKDMQGNLREAPIVPYQWGPVQVALQQQLRNRKKEMAQEAAARAEANAAAEEDGLAADNDAHMRSHLAAVVPRRRGGQAGMHADRQEVDMSLEDEEMEAVEAETPSPRAMVPARGASAAGGRGGRGRAAGSRAGNGRRAGRVGGTAVVVSGRRR